jgi:hypothetical protein
MSRLEERGFATDAMLVHRAHRSEDSRSAMLEAVDRCDLLVLAFPLYVDSLPASLVRTLESIADGRVRHGGRRQRLVAIVNSGFPEAEQSDTALRICRRFAHETGFEWAGGLALGGGEAVDGRALRDVRGMARNAISSLDLAAKELAVGRPVPDDAVRKMAKRIVWNRLYTWMGARRWRRLSAGHGVRDRLRDRPYES